MANVEVFTRLRNKPCNIFLDKVYPKDNSESSILDATLARFSILLKEDGLSSNEEELTNAIVGIVYDDGKTFIKIKL